MTQHTFAIADFDRYAKTTKREIFLEEMDRVIPWGDSLIEPHYPNAENARPGSNPLKLEYILGRKGGTTMGAARQVAAATFLLPQIT